METTRKVNVLVTVTELGIIYVMNANCASPKRTENNRHYESKRNSDRQAGAGSRTCYLATTNSQDTTGSSRLVRCFQVFHSEG